MARNPKPTKKKSPDRRARPNASGGGRPRRGRPKFCVFCRDHAVWVDYKDVGVLKKFINDRGRIRARGATGTCAQHQRDVASAIKTARELALLPYVVRTTAAESRGGRGGERRGSGPVSPVPAPDSDTSETTPESDAQLVGAEGTPQADGAAQAEDAGLDEPSDPPLPAPA